MLIKAATDINYRLPQNLKPYLYEIKIQPFIGNQEQYGSMSFKFIGEISMHFTCQIPTNKIVFHSKNLDLKNYNLYSLDTAENESISILDIDFDSIREFAIISIDQDCKFNSTYLLNINYTGDISENLTGFYRSSYVDSLNHTF